MPNIHSKFLIDPNNLPIKELKPESTQPISMKRYRAAQGEAIENAFEDVLLDFYIPPNPKRILDEYRESQRKRFANSTKHKFSNNKAILLFIKLFLTDVPNKFTIFNVRSTKPKSSLNVNP